MRVLGYSLLLAALLCVIVPVTICVLAVQDHPVVQANRTIGAEDYDRAEKLVRRAQYALAEPGQSTTISADQLGLESLASFVTRSLNGLTGTIRVVPGGVVLIASYALPQNPVGRYINMVVGVRESRSGLDIATIDIGRLHLGPWLSRLAVRFAASVALGDKLGGDVLKSVRGLAVRGQWVTLTIRPDATIENRFKQRVTDVAVFARQPAIAFYYRKIMEIDAKYRQTAVVPFVVFLQPLLSTAGQRSAQGDPVAEMHGLVFALALYFGGDRLDRLRETLLPSDLAQIEPPEDENVVVRGRHDHVQHFIVSAAFTLSGGVGFTTTIGEAKEFDDLMRGGSDFSFQDIAADRTGITFARLADTPAGARFLESLGDRPLSEGLFFPVVSDLPDGMAPKEFDATYHDIESAAFKAMLADIDRRIAACGAYKS